MSRKVFSFLNNLAVGGTLLLRSREWACELPLCLKGGERFTLVKQRAQKQFQRAACFSVEAHEPRHAMNGAVDTIVNSAAAADEIEQAV
jgi:hypothetical protein